MSPTGNMEGVLKDASASDRNKTLPSEQQKVLWKKDEKGRDAERKGENAMERFTGTQEEGKRKAPDAIYAKVIQERMQENQYRPAAMDPFSTVVRQMLNLAHSELYRLGCVRLHADKNKATIDGSQSRKFKPEETHKQQTHESIERKLQRLKVYRRCLSALALTFRAYQPILYNIKKTYEQMLTHRLKQFHAAQQEKGQLYRDKMSIARKIDQYVFPEQKKVVKAQKYLELLLMRISKYNDAIKFITEVLSRMERALSDHYESQRDLQDQILMLDLDLTDRIAKSKQPMKKFDVPESEDGKVDLEGLVGDDLPDDESEEEEGSDIEEDMDEDKRMVLILSYAVCLKDLEETDKKLKVYENKYQNVSPRHELEISKIKVKEEREQVKVLSDEKEALTGELTKCKDENEAVNEEIAGLRELPEDTRVEAMKQKFRDAQPDEEEMDEDQEEEEEEDEETLEEEPLLTAPV